MTRASRLLPLLACLLLIACGQKPGVEFSADGGAPAAGGGSPTGRGTATTRAGQATVTTRAGQAAPAGGGGAVAPAAGGGAAPVTGGGGGASAPAAGAGGGAADPGAGSGEGAGTSTGGDTTAGDPAAPDETAPDGGQAPADPGSPAAPSGPCPTTQYQGDATGNGDIIKIGIHAPVTGAAPFPQRTFEQGKDVYWKFLATKGGVCGKNVEVVFRDDEFNPRRAVEVCREMVENEKVFLLVGGGGADQITACAEYADGAGVPYLSAGVNTNNVDVLATYFAISQTYEQQGLPLAQMIRNKLAMTKVAVLIEDTPNFIGGRDAFISAAQGQGLEIVYNDKISKNASQTEVLTKAGQLKNSNAEVVWVLLPPAIFLSLAQQSSGQGYNPQYMGPGITGGFNTVAQTGCPGIGPAIFLSPFPQLDVIDQLDPDYKPAYRQFNNNAEGDDIGIALWGLNKAIGAMFIATGPNMTREAFIQTLESGQTFTTNVFPPVTFAPGNHFGAEQFHTLQADCNTQPPVYRTIDQFITGY